MLLGFWGIILNVKQGFWPFSLHDFFPFLSFFFFHFEGRFPSFPSDHLSNGSSSLKGTHYFIKPLNIC